MNHTPSTQRSENPYRLPPHVVPTRYDLRLEPDLTTFTFAGKETVTSDDSGSDIGNRLQRGRVANRGRHD
jgi:hypothetical protein